MTDRGNITPFENEVRAALAVPAAQPEFVENLQVRLMQRAAQKPGKARRPFILQLKWAAPAAVLALLLAAVLLVGPQRVLAAVRGLFGYIPGVGIVQEGDGLQVLAEPVLIEREGITFEVQEGAADALRTILVYQVDGLSVAAANSQGEAAPTGGFAVLLLPDGRFLTETGRGMKGWGTGYQTRLVFPALPPDVSEFILLIERLDTMPSGAAPEDWQVPLRFEPAPPDFEMLPVYEVTAQIEPPTPPSSAPVAEEAKPEAGQNGIEIVLDRVVELEDGYLLEGHTSWEDQPYQMVTFDGWQGADMTLTDAQGNAIPYEHTQVDNSAWPASETSRYWALQTNSKTYPGPWTLSMTAMKVYQVVDDLSAAFTIDFGSDVQLGQTWQLDQTIEVKGMFLHAVGASLREQTHMGHTNPVLELVVEADESLIEFSLDDPANRPKEGQYGGAGMGWNALEGNQRAAVIGYYEIPSGQHALQVISISYEVSGNWQMSWSPPETNSENAATQPEQACLSPETWQQTLEQLAALPEGLSGRLLVETHIGELMPQMSLVNLDGSSPQVLGIGGWSSLSPDGTTAAYIESDGPGLMLMDIASGETRLLPGSVTEDYHAVWSPDGEWLAFVRSNAGIYISRPDGSGMRQVVDASKIRFLAGWLPDNRGLVITSLGPDGSQVQQVNVETGEVEEMFMIDQVKGGFMQVAPDGSRLAFSELVFGTTYYSIFTAKPDGSQKRLAVALEDGAVSGAWSADGRWLALAVPIWKDGVKVEVTVILQSDTCQVFLLPGVEGRINSWVEAP